MSMLNTIDNKKARNHYDWGLFLPSYKILERNLVRQEGLEPAPFRTGT